MDRERLDDWCEKGMLGLVLAVLVFTPLAIGTVRTQEFAIVQWMTLGLIGLWLTRFAINPRHRLLWVPMCWPVLGFALYAIGRYLAADIEYVARKELIRVLVYTTIFFVVVNNLHRQETTQILGLTLITLATALSIYALIQFFSASDEITSIVGKFTKPDGYRKRGSATFISPNNLAGYLEILLPLSIAFTVTGRFTPLQKIFLAYASVVIFAGISVTVSRGGWLAAGVALAALFYHLVRQRDYWRRAIIAIGVLGTIFGVFLLTAEMSPNRAERFDRAHEVEDVRFKLWGPALEMWRDHPWFGVGPAHFNERFRQYRQADPDVQIQPDRAHNDYLNTLADWGTTGALLIAACWILFYFQVFRSWNHVLRAQNDLSARRSNKSAFVLGSALGLGALLVHAFFDFNLHVPANAILAVVLLALVAAHYRFATENHWHTVSLRWRVPINAALALLFIYLGIQAWIINRESFYLNLAHDAAASTEQEGLFKKAAAINPSNHETAFALGELFRLRSFEGTEGYRENAAQAMVWFERAAALHPYDPNPLLRLGMCHDWLEQHDKAAPYFARAGVLDPNGFLTLAYKGWHHYQIKEFSAARKLFQQSAALVGIPERNPVAFSYLKRMFDQRTDPIVGQ